MRRRGAAKPAAAKPAAAPRCPGRCASAEPPRAGRCGAGRRAGGSPEAGGRARCRRRPAGPLSPLVRKMAREHNLDLDAGEGHRRRRPDHQAGRGSLRLGAIEAGGPGCSTAARRARRSCRRAGTAPAAPRRRPAAACRTGQDAHRAHEHDADQDRRAHGDVQAHFAARDHDPPRGHDQSGEDARDAQGAVPGGATVSASPTCRSSRAPRWQDCGSIRCSTRRWITTTSSTTTRFISGSRSRWRTA